MLAAKIPLLLHLLVEVPACLSFLLQPHTQLCDANPSQEAVLVCRNLGGLLLATNYFCAQFLFRGGDETFQESGNMVARALAIYHLFPIARAWTRLRGQKQEAEGTGKVTAQPQALGGPVVHLIVHVGLLLALSWAAWQEAASL